MNHDTANVIRMRLKRCNLLRGIVVVDSQLKVVRTADNPVLARNESTRADGHIGQLKGFDNRLFPSTLLLLKKVCTYICLVRPDGHLARVKGCQDPWLGAVVIDAFDPLALELQDFFQVESHDCVCAGAGWPQIEIIVWL